MKLELSWMRSLTIPGSESPEQHAATVAVWSELVTSCQAERVIIIAQSYGGVVTQSRGRGAEICHKNH